MISSENLNKPDKPAPDAPIAPSYSQEDVQQILHLALARQEQSGEMSRAQMLEIASDLGITPDALQAAEKEWVARQGEFQQRQVFDTYRRSQLKEHLVRYSIVNSFLVLLNLASTHDLSWSLYILLAWGLGLALQGWKTYQTEGEEYDRAFQRWRVKQQLGQSFTTLVNKWIKPQ
ncbi:2TM domain-containing protein [Kamptonema formosum]|uniref:2TM domain-containing protein n=1 Tax=Kamptonema formosum TaxID=331992 RepID=UPI000345E394|nr:2TM domain-containing protein [Oscillatoria sp. PCC 10802]